MVIIIKSMKNREVNTGILLRPLILGNGIWYVTIKCVIINFISIIDTYVLLILK